MPIALAICVCISNILFLTSNEDENNCYIEKIDSRVKYRVKLDISIKFLMNVYVFVFRSSA